MTELESAARERLADAEALLAAGRFSSAIAMGVYALEIQLKIVICRRLDLQRLPRAFEIHDLKSLMILSGLAQKITKVKRPRGIDKNWSDLLTVSMQIDQFRYTSDPSWNEELATRLLGQLRDPPNGLLLWLSKQA